MMHRTWYEMKLDKMIPMICLMYLHSVYKHYNMTNDQFKQAHIKHNAFIKTSIHGIVVQGYA